MEPPTGDLHDDVGHQLDATFPDLPPEHHQRIGPSSGRPARRKVCNACIVADRFEPQGPIDRGSDLGDHLSVGQRLGTGDRERLSFVGGCRQRLERHGGDVVRMNHGDLPSPVEARTIPSALMVRAQASALVMKPTD